MIKLIILHDDGLLYFEALARLVKQKKIVTEVYYVHFMKMLAKGIVRRDLGIAGRALASIMFFAKSFYIKGSMIVAGIAPYDPSIILWTHLLRHNKVIYHTSWPYWTDEDYPVRPGVLKKLAFKAWKYFINHENTSVVCIIGRTKDEIAKKYGKSNAKIFVVPHSVNPEYFYPGRAEKNSEFRVLFAGRLVREKGLEQLKEVIRLLKGKGYSFGVIGGGRDKYLLESTFKEPNVKYYGRIKDRKEVGDIMRRYDVFLLPSYKTRTWEELFGIVIIEAMACGLAVVSTDSIGPRNIIRKGKNGILVKQKDPAAMAKNIEKLKRDRSFMKKLVKNGKKTAERYRIEKISKKWMDLFPKIAGPAGR